MKIPKTAAGIGLIIFGGICSLIPAIGPAVSPAIIKAGEAVTVWGATAKAARAVKEKSMKSLFVHEKQLIKKTKGYKS